MALARVPGTSIWLWFFKKPYMLRLPRAHSRDGNRVYKPGAKPCFRSIRNPNPGNAESVFSNNEFEDVSDDQDRLQGRAKGHQVDSLF